MLIGGFEKVYEIGRIFRNEGIDARHNPEFTTIEVYRSYQNANYMRVKTEQLFHTLAQKLAITNLTFNQQVINITKPFAQLTMLEAIKHYAGVDLNNISVSQAQRLAQQHQLDLAEFQHDLDNITLAFFDKYVEKKLIQPTFITDYPLATSPLAKSKFGDPTLADRFELFIGGIEFANGYSELNDPQEQQIRFQQQAQQQQLGNEEIAAFDKEFIEALEYGMPPAAGLGIGIDRLVMLFSQQNSIKEVIAFPQLKEKS
jgi:lysyl-tRNA synthetase class 2